ncbi:MAG: GNAT family N-acetyltransferase [Anaeroplasmataceae bacterium]|nr:GNAT family N-acetyltransferase [Anaeroplasmataceae bacterium]
MVIFEQLDLSNIEEYISYLKTALKEEPNLMTITEVDEEGIKARMLDPLFHHSTSILAKENGIVVGRIEYHFYGCIQGGYKMAYVNWVYVLKAYRHKGIAQMLFLEFEKDCKKNNIDQYFLIRATNEDANRFYNQFENAELNEVPLLRKYLTLHS